MERPENLSRLKGLGNNVLKANMANYKILPILQDESKMKKRWDKFALST